MVKPGEQGAPNCVARLLPGECSRKLMILRLKWLTEEGGMSELAGRNAGWRPDDPRLQGRCAIVHSLAIESE